MTIKQIVQIAVADIEVPASMRPADAAKVEALADSIGEIGLQTPVTIHKQGEDGPRVLVAGRHRLEAARKLGWSHIAAYVSDLDELHRELWTIDENLMRAELGTALEAKAIARRKEIYEALHPETKPGQAQAAGMNRALGHDVTDKMSATFAKDTAKQTGKSERQIRRAAATGVAVAPDVIDAVNGTPMDKAVELHAIEKLPYNKQRQAVEMVKAGEAPSLRDAADKIAPKKTESSRPWKKGVKRLVHAWEMASKEDRETFMTIKKLVYEHEAWCAGLLNKARDEEAPAPVTAPASSGPLHKRSSNDRLCRPNEASKSLALRCAEVR